jgi:beta-glucanase (GH16 family)
MGLNYRILWILILIFQHQLLSAQRISPPPGMRLVWADEFDQPGLPDPLRWGYHVGDGCNLPMGCGWGNQELQYYTAARPENARVEDGKLIIEAHRESFESRQYTSARLITQGRGAWRYGRIEVRAKVASVKGSWPAIWMLPASGAYGQGAYGGWPHSGEIDIMEHVGYLPDSIFANTHTWSHNGMLGNDKPGGIRVAEAQNNFHTYALEWHPDRLDFFVDGQQFHTYVKSGNYESWPFDQPFYLVINLAVGGGWGGKFGVDESAWPQRFEVDYVRVFQHVKNEKKSSR